MGKETITATALRFWIKKRGVTQASLAERSGVAQNYISQIHTGTRDGSIETIQRIATALDISLPEFFACKDQENGLTTLGVYAVAGAGPAWEAEEAEPIFSIAVPQHYLRPNITPLFIRGTSMEPAILDCAVVGVNRGGGDIIQGKIYAVRLPYEGIVVKRLYLDHDKREFVLCSDNKSGDHQDIRMQFNAGDSFIYGQVVWVLQSYEKIVV